MTPARLYHGSPAMAPRIRAALARGVSYTDIALLLNVPTSTVRAVRCVAGLPTHAGNVPIARTLPAKGCVCRGCHSWHGGDCDSDLAARLRGTSLLSTGPDETCAAWRAGA